MQGRWPDGCALAALDPSPHDRVLGWPLRNCVALLAAHFLGQVITLIALRSLRGRPNADKSLRFKIRLPGGGDEGRAVPPVRVGGWEAGSGQVRTACALRVIVSGAHVRCCWKPVWSAACYTTAASSFQAASGWLQVAWKEARLAAALDAAVQAKQARALHLELMKWRAAPALDLPAIATKRCLLLGARTAPLPSVQLPVV